MPMLNTVLWVGRVRFLGAKEKGNRGVPGDVCWAGGAVSG